MNKQVYVVIFSVHLHQLCLEVFAHPRKVQAQPFDGIAIEDMAAVFGNKDQMNVHLKNTVPARS